MLFHLFISELAVFVNIYHVVIGVGIAQIRCTGLKWKQLAAIGVTVRIVEMNCVFGLLWLLYYILLICDRDYVVCGVHLLRGRGRAFLDGVGRGKGTTAGEEEEGFLLDTAFAAADSGPNSG